MAISAFCTMLVGLVLALCPFHAVFADPPAAPAPITFAVGDELNVSFYEPFNNDAKWAAIGQVREPGPSFYLHDELSGNYTVASDWTISLPIIGDVVVAHLTAAETETILEKDFQKVVGHPGFVTISVAARTPLYILGMINKPGVYPFQPNMTPLQLVALAGGYKTDLDTQSSVEAINASASQTAELVQLRNALAQFAVLQAEINNAQPQPQQQLVDLVGQSGADALVQAAEADRKTLVQNQTDQIKALQSAVDAAETAIVTDQARLQPTKDSADLLQARLNSLKTLSRDGLAAQPMIEQAQAEALDSQDRWQNVAAVVGADQHQLVLAKTALATFISDNQLDLNHQLAEQQATIDSLTPQVAASAEVVKLLTSQDAPQNSGDIQFTIVRQGQLIAAQLATELQPGDVLQAAVAPAGATASAAQAVNAPLPAPAAKQLASANCPLPTGCF